ncbi:interleukin-15 receptor subunit alpha isoform X4 [Artibeus jamaicensis]|uniref:interleukin-15 receptor subunit alpha isoform X4 n=1 Tax=Artibeus jamaicensis TaxID=9417 RepID=UPI00187BD608|nr:interleukin-15 receptor subunit alpha isoform X4 [Artibeus jamaicensis]
MVVESKARTRLLRDCWLSNIPTLLLLLLLLRPPATLGATCSTPISVEHANIQVKSYNENSRERYICNFGFKRKAGTSSLTKCLRNEDTNITQWTIPSLKCIRDPSLTRPRPPSTVAPAGVTPEPDSPSPSGKDCYPRQNWGGPGMLPASRASPPQFQGYWQKMRHCCIRDLLWPSLSKLEPAFTTMATKPGTTPGSRLMTPKPPSAETTEITGNEPSQDQSQTTAKALEHTLSASEEKPAFLLWSLFFVLHPGSVW